MVGILVVLILALTALALFDASPARMPVRADSLPASAADGAIAVARRRLARGEIDREEFDRIATILRG